MPYRVKWIADFVRHPVIRRLTRRGELSFVPAVGLEVAGLYHAPGDAATVQAVLYDISTDTFVCDLERDESNEGTRGDVLAAYGGLWEVEEWPANLRQPTRS